VRGSVVVRILAALVVTCVAAAGLWFAFLRHDKPEGANAELDFSRIHEDASPPDRFDTGQKAIISNNPTDSGSNYVVRDGKLTYDPTKDGPAGAAYSTDMRAPITRIGARWVFEPRGINTSGAVSLSISQSVQPEAPWVVPPIPIQFVVTPINWHLALQKDFGSPRVDIAAEPFKDPLKVDGSTASEVDITIDEGSVTIKLPDGSLRHYRDARIAQWKGNYASFGLYSNNGATDSVGGFEKIWAATGPGG
jgi:hypothetical protein